MNAVTQGSMTWSTYCWNAAGMLCSFVIGRHPLAHVPMIHAASHVDHEKRFAWFSISLHASSSVPIVMGLHLGPFYKKHQLNDFLIVLQIGIG